jgi:hypothetical protein
MSHFFPVDGFAWERDISTTDTRAQSQTSQASLSDTTSPLDTQAMQPLDAPTQQTSPSKLESFSAAIQFEASTEG